MAAPCGVPPPTKLDGVGKAVLSGEGVDLRVGSGMAVGAGVAPAAPAFCTSAVAIACARSTIAVASALWIMAVACAAAFSTGLGSREDAGEDAPVGAAGEQPTSQAEATIKTSGISQYPGFTLAPSFLDRQSLTVNP